MLNENRRITRSQTKSPPVTSPLPIKARPPKSKSPATTVETITYTDNAKNTEPSTIFKYEGVPSYSEKPIEVEEKVEPQPIEVEKPVEVQPMEVEKPVEVQEIAKPTPPKKRTAIFSRVKEPVKIKEPIEIKAEELKTEEPIQASPQLKPAKIISRQVEEPVKKIVPAEQTEFGFLTAKIKNTGNFQTTLGNLAASDFRHDFHINVNNRNQDLSEQFSKGLPAKIDKVYDEDNALNAVIDLDELNVADFKDYLKDKLQPDNPGIITVRVPRDDANNVVTKFQVIKYAAENYDKSIQQNFGADFCEKTGLCNPGGNAYLIVDFNQHGFVSKLKEGTKSENVIHYLATPEVINDPAPKPSIHDVSIFNNNDNGVRLISYIQTDAAITNYTKYDKNDSNFNNNFFTRYNFSINPITQIFQKGAKSKLDTTLNISYDRGDPSRLPFTSEITDSKKQNSKKALNSFIEDVIPSVLKKPNDEAALFEFNSKLQQKRSGDWLQGLCCLDVSKKKFSRILPNPERDVAMNFNGPIYLLTHDRIALAYALCNGVNTIYLANDKTTFVFKNNADPIIKTSMKPIEEIMYEKIKVFCEPTLFEKNKANKEIYTDVRNKILNTCETELYKSIQNANELTNKAEKMQSRDLLPNLKNNFKTYIKKYQNLFTSAIEMQFLSNTLINIDSEWDKITKFRDAINSETTIVSFENLNEEQIKQISSIILSINSINLAFDKANINDFRTDSNNYDEKIENTRNKLIKLLKKTNVYETASNVLTINSDTNSQTINSFVSRLLDFARPENPPMICDQFIFLTILQTMSKNESEKEYLQKIVECIRNFKTIIINYGKALEETYPPDGRRKIPEDEKMIFFRSANLVYESLLLLDIEEKQPTTPMEVVMTSIEPVFMPAPENIEKIEIKEVVSDGSENFTKKRVLDESNDIVLVNTTNKQRRLNIAKIGRQSNVVEKSDNNVMDIVGGAGPVTNDNKLLLIYDTLSDQITFQLMSNFNDTKPLLDDIQKYYKVISVNSKGEVGSNEEYITTGLDVMISSFLNSESVSEEVKNMIKIITEDKTLLDIPKTRLLVQNCLIFLLFSSFIGVGDKNIPIEFIPRTDTSYKELLQDTNFSPHPLLSIYMILLTFYNQFEPEFRDDPFYDTYITYVKLLSKITDVIIDDYLNDSADISKITNAYFIGYCLRTMLFTANKSPVLFETLCKKLNLTQDECRMFCLKNGMFGSMFGDIIVKPGDFEEVSGLLFLNSPLFLDFINNKVNLKQILQTPEEIPAQTDDSEDKLEEQIDIILNKIVEKINIDRLGNLSQMDIPLVYVTEPSDVAGKVEEINIEKSPKQFDLNKLLLPSYKSSSVSKLAKYTPSQRSEGGTRKYRNKKKHTTRGKRKTYKNKTIKKHRRNKHKKSIKH